MIRSNPAPVGRPAPPPAEEESPATAESTPLPPRQGSGNTANIGSIVDIADLKSGNGTFSQLGEEWFDEYWINHGSATMIKDGKTTKITTLNDFLEFKGRKDLLEKIVSKNSNKK